MTQNEINQMFTQPTQAASSGAVRASPQQQQPVPQRPAASSAISAGRLDDDPLFKVYD